MAQASDQHRNRRFSDSCGRALGYVRVSTVEQVSGFGLDVQERAIRDYCRANRIHLVNVLRDEGQSGSNGLDSRVGLSDALARLERRDAETLVVYRMDRLARDFVLQETIVERLRANGTPVRSASEPDIDTDTDDPTRVLLRQLLGAVAQYERAVIRGRMVAGRRAKADAGGFIGGRAPYGFRLVGGQLEPEPAEAEVVELVRRLSAGGASLRTIAAKLEARGVSTRNGGPWHSAVVGRLLKRT
jgi:DNA invertase Pin-like site-specific DNA recombinase